MAQDISKLSQRILQIQRGLGEAANEKVKNASRGFLTTVVEGTPADTGQAISSWKVGLNYQPTGARNLAPGSKGSTRSAAISATMSMELPKISRRVTGMTVYIVNTTSYISALNDGRSSQAPAGFIDRARLEAGAKAKLPRLID